MAIEFFQGKPWGSSLLERALESCQIVIYSIFNSCACIFQGAIFVLQLNVWRSFAWFWSVLCLKNDELICRLMPTLDISQLTSKNLLNPTLILSHPESTVYSSAISKVNLKETGTQQYFKNLFPTNSCKLSPVIN